MRLWHKDLIEVLPDKQLVGQWRECCLIAKGLHDGTLNHVLVNRVKDYPEQELIDYTAKVWFEMKRRGKKPLWVNFTRSLATGIFLANFDADVFKGWHNDRYLKQCYYNLQEKYDCGGITPAEWERIERAVKF